MMGTEHEDSSTPAGTESTTAAGDGLSDSELIDQVADQTDSASPNADTAGRNWNGESDPPEPPA